MDGGVGITVLLTRGASCLISVEDADLLSYRWYSDNQGYARRSLQQTMPPYAEFIHRIVLERMLGRTLQRGEQADHINGNRLDNRRGNLRIATPAQNSQNRKKPAANKSGYKGVCLHNGKWQATLKANRKTYYLGRFATAEAAHEAYECAAEVYHSAFRRTDTNPLPAEVPA